MKAAQFDLHARIEDHHWWFRGRRQIISRIVRAALPNPCQSMVIDIGCGTGANIAALADQYTCLGADPSADAIRLAQQRFPAVRFTCQTTPFPLEEIPNQTRMFLLLDVLEHVPDDTALLAAIASMCRTGDQVLLTVPADMALWSPHDIAYGHYRRYDITRLTQAWNGLPFKPLLVSYFNARLYPAIKTMRRLSRWRGTAWGAANTDLDMPAAPINRLLEKIFAAESRTLLQLYKGQRTRGFQHGVSLIALLRQEP
jgi:SAM-dependent methyltransferase